MEVAVGSALFTHVAMDEQAALRLLRSLNQTIVERQAVMRGNTRAFEPSAGDPVHVLLIDELAVLTGYASRDVVNEASTLLKRILTQGRARWYRRRALPHSSVMPTRRPRECTTWSGTEWPRTCAR